MPIPLGVLAVAGAGAAGGANSFDLLETTLLSSAAASVTFSNLNNYSDYKHLQVRWTGQTASTFDALTDNLRMRFNGITSGVYARHRLRGQGTNVLSNADSSQTEILLESGINRVPNGNAFAAGVIDILDFSSADKNTTIRAFTNAPATNGDSFVSLHSGLYGQTTAVTSFQLYASTNLVAGSRFSLYGIK
jgi:hypothetical protein